MLGGTQSSIKAVIYHNSTSLRLALLSLRRQEELTCCTTRLPTHHQSMESPDSPPPTDSEIRAKVCPRTTSYVVLRTT